MSGRLTAAEQVRRNRSLVADRARGWGWARLSERYGLTVRQCQNIWKHRPPFDLAAEADALAPLREMLESLEVAAEDYAELAETAQSENVRLGAMNRRVDTQLHRYELLCASGLAARSLSDAQTKETLSAVFKVLSQLDLSDAQHSQLAEAAASAGPALSHQLRRAIEPAPPARAA